MSDNSIFKVTPSKKIDTSNLRSGEIYFPNEQGDPSNAYDEEIFKNIFSGELDNQINSIKYFEYKLKYHEIILPDEYLEVTYDIFQSHLDNEEIVKLLLAFYRHSTGFESRMQDFLIEKELINLVIPFFPAANALAILGNLSIKNINILSQLLTMNVLDQIFPLINIFSEEKDKSSEELCNFVNAIDFLDSLLSNFDSEYFSSYEEDFISKFIEIFDILCLSYEKTSVDQAKTIAKVFTDYIETDIAFIHSFYEKQQLKIFLEKDFSNNKIYESILEMIMSIICEFEHQGVCYLQNFDIINWIGKQIFNESQEVVYRCFSVLIKMIGRCDPQYILANECIENDFLVKAVDKLNDFSEIIYRLKFTLYEFICTLFSYASDDQIPLMIEEKALDLIIENYDIISDQQSSRLIWNSLQRLLPFKIAYEEKVEDEKILTVYAAIQKLKGNALFINWLLDRPESKTDIDFDWHREVLTLFIDEHEDEQL